ncbi:MAG: branched-chain amino acid transport system ATP-binding protein [Methylobacteriaceae bacterium]|jgi:branched-chain amino acid transport system ATP-binding protein|nr:branched-chain amino acid transport system ATP-binding protein [Methylobacteriaceae bacterium]
MNDALPLPLLDVRGLVLGYGRTDAVKGIDLSVEAGRVVTLIGANGAGKTTTLRGLSGLLRPRAGSIRLAGNDISSLAANRIARLGIVQVPEGRQVFANMTIDENLRMGAYLLSDRAEEARRREHVLARFPRLAERHTQSAGLLSGGEQQMLAIGRAMMADPKLLLLDEPSMGLAPRFVEEIFRIISEFKAEQRTILLVEQNARAALEIADQAYVLESGRITLSGAAAQVANDPSVVAAYLGGA